MLFITENISVTQLIKTLKHGQCSTSHQKKQISHQVVIWSDPKQLSEVAEGHRGVGLKPKVWVVVGWSEVTAFTVRSKMAQTGQIKVDRKVY